MREWFGGIACAAAVLLPTWSVAEPIEIWPYPACTAVQIFSTPSVGQREAPPTFSARRILDVDFRVLFPLERLRHLSGDLESIELRLFTPNGHLYQSTVVPVTLTRGGVRTIEGYSHALPVAQLVPYGQDGRAHGFSVTAPPMPVAGTLIVTDSLYGRWRVDVWPNGAARPCSAHFSIAP